MRTRRSGSALLAAAIVAVLLGVSGARGQEPVTGTIDEAGWQGVLGVRTPASAAQRYVVLLREPSLADRVREAGGHAGETQMRTWTAATRRLQDQFLARMAAVGVRAAAEHRFTRVLNGFSSRLDPTSLTMLERDREVAGVYPVRIAYPAQTGDTAGVAASAVTGLELPGLDGTGITVALLDTGVDATHPYIRRNVLPGVDLITQGTGGVAQRNPAIPGRTERHGTELAGIVAGVGGPSGLRGVAPGASIFPVRVAGWQPDAEGGYTVYARTDQILAGLEAAVDPNEDGDVHDAARVALVGVVEPYASFPDGPLARAVAGATALDTLVVVPAGNDGRAGPAFGSIAGPGGAPDALTVAAADTRLATPTMRVHVRAGLRVLFDEPVPLGGAPTNAVTASIEIVNRRAVQQGISGLFRDDGLSTVSGRAALLPRGVLSEESVDEATAAGALAVLVDGPLPAGAFSLDVPTGIPVAGLPRSLVREIRVLLASGIPVTISVGAVDLAESRGSGAIAAFSSRGLAFGGGVKPELVAAGVSIPTSEPGRDADGDVRFGTVSGTSAAAAVVAGAAAVLAQGRPRVGARGLHALLVGSAQRTDLDATASGAGQVDLQTAVQLELHAEPAAISFGVPTRAGELEQTLLVTNVSTRRLAVSIGRAALAPRGVELTVDPRRLTVRPGATAAVRVRADTSDLSDQPGIATGQLVLRVAGSPEANVPWVVVVPEPRVDLVSEVDLRTTSGRVSDATPAVLSLVAGAVTSAADPQLRLLEELEVQLWRGDELLGVLARRREILPGRYAFGLTGRRADGARLRRGQYVVRVVARPGDGTSRQVERVAYRVR
jgi:minor extracellular serine protease Vpr